MRDEPKVRLKCLSIRALKTIKGVVSFRQQGCGHGSRNQLRSV